MGCTYTWRAILCGCHFSTLLQAHKHLLTNTALLNTYSFCNIVCTWRANRVWLWVWGSRLQGAWLCNRGTLINWRTCSSDWGIVNMCCVHYMCHVCLVICSRVISVPSFYITFDCTFLEVGWQNGRQYRQIIEVAIKCQIITCLSKSIIIVLRYFFFLVTS